MLCNSHLCQMVCVHFLYLKLVIEALILLVSVSIVKDTVLSKSSIIMISLAFLHPSLSGNVLKSTDMLNKLPVGFFSPQKYISIELTLRDVEKNANL